METNNLREVPFATVHPTEIIKDELAARGMTQKQLAELMGMKPSNVSRLLKGANITASTAAKLELALDIPAEVWVSLQARYEADKLAIEMRERQSKASTVATVSPIIKSYATTLHSNV